MGVPYIRNLGKPTAAYVDLRRSTDPCVGLVGLAQIPDVKHSSERARTPLSPGSLHEGREGNGERKSMAESMCRRSGQHVRISVKVSQEMAQSR